MRDRDLFPVIRSWYGVDAFLQTDNGSDTPFCGVKLLTQKESTQDNGGAAYSEADTFDLH